MRKILVTGATGFVGNAVIDSLNRHGYAPVALVRKGSEKKLEYPAEIVNGDVLDKDSLSKALKDIDAVIHLVGIIREYPKKGVTFARMHTEATENITSAMAEKGMRRYVHMSANGTRENAVSMYHITKYNAEQAVKYHNIDYTIFRPSLIYGPGDTFINMLAGYMRSAPAFTYFGDGSYPMMPVYVRDVADCFVKALDNEETYDKTYHLCGEDLITYKELLRMISRSLKRKHLLIPVPEIFIKAGLALFGRSDWFPMTKDQFTMLTEGNTCSDSTAFKLLDVKRHRLEETVSSYLK